MNAVARPPSPPTALPGRMVDLIRDGVSPGDLRVRGDHAVWAALVSTAASAQQRGHTYGDWAGLLAEVRSALGRQARIKAGRDRERTRTSHERTIRSAWEAAAEWLGTAPPPISRDDALAHVAAVHVWLADADADLTDADRAVLAAACDVAAHHGTTRPALPRRALVTVSGLGERAVRTTLDRLHDRGLLVLDTLGHPGGPNARRRRASLYRLPTAEAMAHSYLYRGTRSVGPPGQVWDPSSGAPLGPLPGVGPLTTTTDPPEEGTAMAVTLTLTAAEPEALAAALAAITRDPTVRVVRDDDSGTVVPLRRRAERSTAAQ